MDLNAQTRIATATAARDTADWARAIVETVADDFYPGDLIRAARKLRVLALMVLDRGVLAERANGATWAEIAAAHNLPEHEIVNRYAAVYDAWQVAVMDPDYAGQSLPAVNGDLTVGLVNDSDPEGLAHALDQWRARHLDPWETPGTRALAELVAQE